MTNLYKFIIAKNGYAYNDVDIRNILFHSDYKLLKQFSELSGTLTFSVDENYKELTLYHNLGYVPVFIPFTERENWDGNIVSQLLPIAADGPTGYIYMDAYVDDTKIVFRVGTSDEFTYYYPFLFDYTDVYSNYDEFDLIFGNDGNGRDGAIRFYNIGLNKNESILSANIEFWISEKGSSNQDAKLQCWGIDEDDCGSIYFNLGREKTTARRTQNVAAGAGSYFGIDVTEQVREIIARNGWANGNHMGFYIFNDGSSSNAWRKDTEYKTYLKIRLPGSYDIKFKGIVFLDKIL